MATTLERVQRILVEHLAVAESAATPDKALTDDLGADSLDMVELVMAAEEEFGIEIPDDAAETWLTVQDCVTGLDRLCAQSGEGA